MGNKAPIFAFVGAVLVLVIGGGSWLLLSWRSSPSEVVFIPSLTKPLPPQPSPQAIVSSIPQTGPSAIDLDQVATLLESGDAAQIDRATAQLHQLAKRDPRNLAIGLPTWIGPLLDAKRFADVDELALDAILQRSFDSTLVQQAQRSRVLALIGAQKYPDALREAKSYYNVAAQVEVRPAIGLLATVLEKVADPVTAERFKAEQMSGKSSQDMLQAIHIDSTAYESAITALEARRGKNGNYSPGNWTARGNLWLLAGKPDEAKDCFRQACPGSATRALRLAVEGYAESLRAESDNPAAADDFLRSLRGGNSDLIAALSDSGNPSADDLRAAAARIHLSGTGPQAAP